MLKPYTVIKRIIDNPKLIGLYIYRYKNICKLLITFIFSFPFRKRLNEKNIWLIREKGTEARDNGYHFFKYIRENHPEINAYYVITKDSPDLKKVEKYKNIIYLNTFRHCLYYLYAIVSANSQMYGAIPDPPELFAVARKLHRKDQKTIHLKHGITKDKLSHELDYDYAKYDLLCCVAERERRFMQEVHGYPDDNIKALGFCRYDNLLKNHEIKRQVLIMPTFRMWLQAVNMKKEATDKEKQEFMMSDFYKHFFGLLSDKRLIQLINRKDFRVIFYPHYVIQPFISCFKGIADNRIIIADREHFDVQQLLLESAILVTDYSSVFFDFAYMGKPEVFFQFDEAQYRSSHYEKGYFDYYKDGFGPVYDKADDVIDEIQNIINNECRMSDTYMKRVNDFFAVRDTNNCKRIFDEVYRKVTKQ